MEAPPPRLQATGSAQDRGTGNNTQELRPIRSAQDPWVIGTPRIEATRSTGIAAAVNAQDRNWSRLVGASKLGPPGSAEHTRPIGAPRIRGCWELPGSGLLGKPMMGL